MRHTVSATIRKRVYSFDFERADGDNFSLPVTSVERVAEYVSELDPPLVHVFAAPDEREGLMEQIGAPSERGYEVIYEGPTATLPVTLQ